MGADIYGNNAVLAELLVGRRPEWSKQPSYTGVPDSTNRGRPMSNAPVCGLRVDLRQRVDRHQAYIKLGVVDLVATTYTVTLGGDDAEYDASAETPATAAELLEGLRAEIAALSGFAADLIDLDGDGVTETIRAWKTDKSTFTTDFGVSGGSGTLVVKADNFSATLDAHALDGGIGPDKVADRWGLIDGGWGMSVGTGGVRTYFPTPGMNQVYIEVKNLTRMVGNGGSVGDFCEVRLGPCVLESDPP